MRMTVQGTRRTRRTLGVVFAGSAAGAIAVFALAAPTTPAAEAAPDPCAASEVARAIGTVATSTGNYLDAHPDTNMALTAIAKQQPGPQSLGALKAYFDANPQVGKDMQQLQSPLVSLSTKCDMPLTLPQLMGLMQAAQSQGGALAGGGLPSGLPGAVQAAQNAAVPSTPASALSTGSGPLPGPVARPAG